MAIDHRITSLKFLRSTGLIPVKVRPGQKDPFPEWDPRTAAAQDHSATLKHIEDTPELNLGALFAGRYVDLDFDSDAPFLMQALDFFLPRTPYVWGRKSKPRSHRIYALTEDFDRGPRGPVLRYIKNLQKDVIDNYSYSLELRGGKPENGLFSVLPGSKHPSGERVEWDKEIDPTVGGSFVDVDILIKSMRLAVVAAMIAPHWTSGVRNDMSLALAGTMWRIRTSAMAAYGMEPDDEAPEGYYVLSEDDATAIFNCVMELADDKHGDERSRLLNLRNTWRKLDGQAEVKVTGGKVLAELIGGEVGPRVVRALYRLLSDNDAAEQIEKLAEQFVMWYGAGVLIDLDMVVNGRLSPWMNKEQARNSLGGKKLIIGDKRIPLVDMLFGSSIINRVMGLTFDPSTPELLVRDGGVLMVNEWRGFEVEPCPQTVTLKEVEPFVDYVKNIVANGDEDAAHWIFAWMADMFKHPSKKPGTALVLVGVQGAGKTFLGEHILAKIIGKRHSGQTNAVTTLTNQFNTIIDNKIFFQCDEAVHSYQRDVASRLKSLITDDSLTIEPKGVNSYKKPNHMRLLFTSNEEHAAIFIDPSPYERRFTVQKVSAAKAQDIDYWQFMHLWTPTALPKIMRWLMDYRYERALVMRPMETAAKREIQRVGVEVEVSWILSRMAAGFPLGPRTHQYWFEAFSKDNITEADKKNGVLRRDHWPDHVMAAAIEADFKDYVRGHGKQVYTGSVITSIRRVLPEGSLKLATQTTVRYLDARTGNATQDRIRLSSWPSVETILQHLKRKYGPVIDQMFEELVDFNGDDALAGAGAVEEKDEF